MTSDGVDTYLNDKSVLKNAAMLKFVDAQIELLKLKEARHLLKAERGKR